MAPTSIDRFQIRGPLGRGGMGTVWRAHDPRLRRDVALKEVHLPEHLSAEAREKAKARVAREAQTAARISHPSVVTIHDVLEVDETPYIVMELLDGHSLEQRLGEAGTLPVRGVEQIARQLLQALREAHRVGVVHRDIKPANIVLTAGGDRAVLTDFGIASVVDGEVSDLTGSGVILGTPEYLAPERLEREGADPPSDLWSLGATLATALNGRSPFRRESMATTLNAVLSGPLPELPAEGVLRDLLVGLLVRSPEQRLTVDQAIGVLDAAPHRATPMQAAPAPTAPPHSAPTHNAPVHMSAAPSHPTPTPPAHGYPASPAHWPAQTTAAHPQPPTEPKRGRGWALAGGSAMVAALLTVLSLMLTGLIPAPWNPPTADAEPSPSAPPAEAPTPAPTDVAAEDEPSDAPVPTGFLRHENEYFTVNHPASWSVDEEPQDPDVLRHRQFGVPGGSGTVDVAAMEHTLIDEQSGQAYLNTSLAEMIGSPETYQDASGDVYRHPEHPSDWDSWVLKFEYSDSERDDERMFLTVVCTTFPDEGLVYMLAVETPSGEASAFEEEFTEIIESFRPLQGP